MSVSMRVIVLITVLALGLTTVWLLNPSQAAAQGDDQGEDGDADVIYVCPNHPEIWSEKPGVCPKCGATLVKKTK
ncbi:MAG: heavy metal-binding domain-containing protein [Candidatus Alcyoniella australis]|nr:heavy metal-binding domain-containing protein [Candidatus Alcyoniella australis]